MNVHVHFTSMHTLQKRPCTSRARVHFASVHAHRWCACTSQGCTYFSTPQVRGELPYACTRYTGVHTLYKCVCTSQARVPSQVCTHSELCTTHKCECASYAHIHFTLTSVHARFTPQSCTLHTCASTAPQPAPTQHTCWAASSTETRTCCATQQHGNTHSAAHSTHRTHLLRSEQHAKAHSDAAHSTHITHLLCSEPRANTEVHAQTHNLTTSQKRRAAPHPPNFCEKAGGVRGWCG